MRSYFGCVTCRQRKVKCDEARPICGPCVKASRNCVFSSNCIFRHSNVNDLYRDAGSGWYPGSPQIWVPIPSHLTFIQVIDPFADEESISSLDERHQHHEHHLVVASPSTIAAAEESIVPTPARSPVPPEQNGILTAVLIQHFQAAPGQWLDSFDSNAYYSIKVPIMAATRPMLRAAACALAAKHLHRLCQGDSVRISQLPHLRKSPLQWIIRAIDWKYESVRLYDQAIHHLKEAIALEIPDDRREEMFAVVAILCMYELSDAPSTEWRAHLSALPFLYCGSPDASSSTEALPDSLLHISRSVFWSLYRQDCLSAFINETQTRLDLSDLILWRNFGLSISSYGHLLPPSSTSTTPAISSASPSPHISSPAPWLDEATLSNALIWLTGKMINYITSGDGINPGDYESPPDQRPSFGTTQEDLLKRWQRLDFELRAWHDTLPASFTPCARTRLSLSTGSRLVARRPAPEHRDADDSNDSNAIDAVVFTVPMCAVTIQTYHMARILLLSNMPQEATAIRSTVTARLHNYRRIAGEVVRHAREVCGISLAGLPDAVLPHTVQPLFVAGQCFEGVPERRLVVDLLRRVECETTWATEYRVQDLRRQWAAGGALV
ncbi:hypothetical protein ASPACDRAFT_126334 [Aspergillus aculeatus ATCC 16872]|uniref:Zn(2)-C6 fungal-type domain-containing protein n=1 Tax=Aspergillus aculeatus (strain ATCC 16872 / CBS 172.66 / WB 5094) TaxID=690307 RepID=A0A1L9WIS9_ASPA1|nr:uncharacterized protein ASPACDRAFT_126334 [Aspergillus aculeatus ATCC 16872]OJJ96060.1 hypothetical protein ASPACDRAFT_126334 [Aspergillus aculeatus ATCC 16872]